MGYDVLCIGSATVDHFLSIDVPFSSTKMGDKVLVSNTESHTGGGGTNAAAALARMGLKVNILTKLGDDHNADLILKELKAYKIKYITQHFSRKNTDSATIISSSKERDRVIFVHKGASRDLKQSDFNMKDLKAKYIYLATLVGKSFQTAKAIADHAKEKNIPLLFNPSSYLAKKGKRYLKRILDAAHIIILNKEEAQMLLDTKSTKMKFLLHELHKLGPRTVVVTNSNKRLHAYHDGKYYMLIPPDVRIIHTAGAGDAFNSGFLAGFMKQYPFEDVLRFAQSNASSVIQHIGTKNKLLTEHEAQKFMKKHKIVVKEI